jgi:hypothetical protein
MSRSPSRQLSILLALLLTGTLHPIPSVHATSVTVLQNADGGGGKSRAFNCMPQDHGLKTTAAFNKASVPLTYLRPLVGASYGCGYEPGPTAADGTATLRLVKSAFAFNAADLNAVNGTVALVKGSDCLFSTQTTDARSSPWWGAVQAESSYDTLSLKAPGFVNP